MGIYTTDIDNHTHSESARLGEGVTLQQLVETKPASAELDNADVVEGFMGVYFSVIKEIAAKLKNATKYAESEGRSEVYEL